MHHVHISTSFMFVLVLFSLGIAGIIAAFWYSMRRDRLMAEQADADRKFYASLPATQRYPETRLRNYEPTPDEVAAFMPRTRVAPVAPVVQPAVVAAPVYHGSDPMLGLAAGMMIGSAMGHHDTVVVHDTPAYVDTPSYSSPSYDSGFSYDSGSSSFDSGSSGGFDASF
jgi:hypothetical protein